MEPFFSLFQMKVQGVLFVLWGASFPSHISQEPSLFLLLPWKDEGCTGDTGSHLISDNVDTKGKLSIGTGVSWSTKI